MPSTKYACGVGRVVMPALISIAGDFCVGIPASLALMFLAPFRLYGFYVALIGAHALKVYTSFQSIK